jgi:hypothetical protein
MLEENDRQKKKIEDEKERERMLDVKAQDAYIKMLDNQENDRSKEVNNRERRAQEFMGRMADTVLKELDVKHKRE